MGTFWLILTALSTGAAVFCFCRMCMWKKRYLEVHFVPPPTKNQKSAAKEPDDTPYTPYDSANMDYDRIFMQRLDDLIAENLTNHAMDVDFIAEKMMISRSLLFSRVKRISGVSVTKYVNQFRIDRSVELLAKPYLSLTEIAESTGFSTLRYYSRVFKSIKGEIPSVYRERMFGQSV